jgi:predicted nucleic acid-binding protein
MGTRDARRGRRLITAIDTNIFSVFWAGVAESKKLDTLLDDARRVGALVICPAVYAEILAHPSATEDKVGRFLQDTGIVVHFSMAEAVWVEAGRRYGRYATRRRKSSGGEAKRLLADFIIGAHALVQADRLMTLDCGRYERDFPELKLV